MSTGTDRQTAPWAALLAAAVGGVLLLTIFVARSGSAVALAGALAAAAVLGGVALTVSLRRRHRAAHHPPSTTDLPHELVQTASAREAAMSLAHTAVAQFGAPAAAVLIEQEGRLTAAGSVGDWALARQHSREPTLPGLTSFDTDHGEPPSFTLDPRNDWLTRIVALQSRPLALERWKELEDVPVALLPLVALAAGGVAVAIPLTYRRRFVGLWVLARRPGATLYTDADLDRLATIARDAGHTLGAALVG